MISADSPPPARFFVALLPPAPIQAEAVAIQHLFQTRYHSQAALRSPPHITLQPPFEWDLADQARLHLTLADFARQQLPLTVELSGFGAFPPRVIFIQVVHTPALMALQPTLMTHLETHLGIVHRQSRQRPFAPHLTVAFRDLKPAAFHRAWSAFAERPFQAQCQVSALTLLIHDGRRWVCDRSYPLGQAPEDP